MNNKTTEVFESKNSNYSSTSVERALKLAEEALLSLHLTQMPSVPKALAAIREALAEPVKQEPVAWLYSGELYWENPSEWARNEVMPFYAAPVDAKAIRAEALEEAAKVCNDKIRHGQVSECQHRYNFAYDDCAAAIRGLK